MQTAPVWRKHPVGERMASNPSTWVRQCRQEVIPTDVLSTRFRITQRELGDQSRLELTPNKYRVVVQLGSALLNQVRLGLNWAADANRRTEMAPPAAANTAPMYQVIVRPHPDGLYRRW